MRALGGSQARLHELARCVLTQVMADLESVAKTNYIAKEAAGAIEQWQKERTGARYYPDACGSAEGERRRRMEVVLWADR